MATPMGPGDEGGSRDIQRRRIKGRDYVLVSVEEYQQLLDELESLDTALEILRTPADASERIAERAPGAKTVPEIGDEMEDGTIYAGVSPDTGKAMYATPKDASGVYDFNEAAQYAKNLDAHGHKDFRVPTKNELNVLYQNRDKGKLKGTFNETGSYPAGWYWSSSQASNYFAWDQCFSDGYQYYFGYRGYGSSLRCVR